MSLREPLRSLLILTLGTSTLPAQEASPVDVGDGPLVVLTQQSTEDPLAMTLLVAECDGDDAARPFWTQRGGAHVAARLDARRVLLQGGVKGDRLVVLDLVRGAHHEVVTGRSPELLCVRGDRLFYNDENPDGSGFPIWVVNWRRPERPRRLTSPSVHRAPIVAGNLAVLHDQTRHEIWTLSLTTGTYRRAYRLPDGYDFPILALSPGGQRLAIGSTNQDHGHLAVVDLATGETQGMWTTLNIRSPHSGLYVPQLPVGWRDDAEVLSVEYFGGAQGFGGYTALVRRSVLTGERLDSDVCDPLLLEDPRPLPELAAPARRSHGYYVHYEHAGQVLYRHDQDAPVASPFAKAGRVFDVSPDCRFAVESSPADGGRWRLLGLGREPLQLHVGPARSTGWLPAHR